MDSTLFLGIFTVFALSLFAIGSWASRAIKTRSDFFLAGRDLGLASVTFTLIAIQLGGTMILGAAEWAYRYGLYGVLYACGMSLGFLLLASGVAARLRACMVTTTAELFEKRYQAPSLRLFAAFISIVSLLGILVAIVVSSRSLLHGLGITHESIFIVFWLIIISYIMLGGLHAVVLTDIAQVIFIVLCITGLIAYSLWALPQGFVSLSALIGSQQSFDASPLSSSALLATFLMPALFSLIEQDLAQPLFAARSQMVALLGAFFAGIFMILFGSIPVYFGMQARLIGLELSSQANPFIAVAEYISSPLVFALVICSIIAAITSTATSLICAISANIVQDFLPTVGNEKNMVRLSKIVTLLVGCIAVYASYYVHKTIIEIAIASYELSVSVLLIPLLGALYSKKPSKYGAFTAALLGLISFVVLNYYTLPIPKEIIILVVSTLGYGIGHYFSCIWATC